MPQRNRSMLIFVKTLTGKIIEIRIAADDLIADIKTLIRIKEGASSSVSSGACTQMSYPWPALCFGALSFGERI